MTERMEAGAGMGERSGAGLSRELGFFSVLVVGVSAVGLAVSGQVPFLTIAGAWPGSSLAAILALAVIPGLFHAYTYAVMGSVAPSPGADYAVTRRVLSAPLAFASSWTFVLVLGVAAGSIIAMIPQIVIPIFFNLINAVGPSAPTMARLAVESSQPGNVVLVGTIFVVLTFLLLMLPPRTVLRTMAVGLALVVLAWALILVILASSSAGAFPAAW